jgi:signal transduction histidine kinase
MRRTGRGQEFTVIRSPLGYPLEPGPEASGMAAALQGEHTARGPRLVEPSSTTFDTDRLREMCHDIRQPVASIIVLADAALSEDSIPSAVRARLGQVREQAEWLGDLLQHLLDPHLVRTAHGKSYDLTQLVSKVVQAERATYGGDLRLRWSEGDMRVRGDAIELRRAIANLLSNAIRAAGPDGTVLVELHGIDDHVLLTIDDSGPGFGMIRRRTGLGLRAVARGLKSYGGHIEYSRSHMGGTRAIVVLRAIDSVER